MFCNLFKRIQLCTKDSNLLYPLQRYFLVCQKTADIEKRFTAFYENKYSKVANIILLQQHITL